SEFGRGKRAYYEVRAIDPRKLSATKRAAQFVYLNRFSFNGVYRTNRKGIFNVPFGSKSGQLPTKDQLVAVSRFIARASFKRADFETAMKRAKQGDFIYLDPPYLKRGRNRGEYGLHSFSTDDIDRLIKATKAASRRGATVLLSYKNAR